MNNQNELFPPLPIEEWEETKNLLHLYLQIVGKIRMKLFPKKNHWWHVTLFISPRGLTTRPIPYDGRIFEINLDLSDHKLIIICSDGTSRDFKINNLSVAEFYKNLILSL